MRPYGFESTLIAGPDCGDIRAQGRKSSIGQLVGKVGQFHSSFHNASSKRAARRLGKRAARRAAAAAVRDAE